MVIAAMAFWGAAVAIGLVSIPEALASDTSSNGCASGSAVTDPANNPGLVSDCETLLASRDALAGQETLNWSGNIPITAWEGITGGCSAQGHGAQYRGKEVRGFPAGFPPSWAASPS